MAAGIDAAWQRFRGRLADALAAMGDGDVLILEVETGLPEDELEGAAPYVQFLCWDDGAALRGEVASNRYLDHRRSLAVDDIDRLVERGWAPPSGDDANFFVFGELREADRLADLAVRALRDAYGVPHPAFLSADGLETDLESGVNIPGPRPGMEPSVDEPLAVMPDSDQQLRTLVDAALRPLLGDTVRHDDDGDVPILEGGSVLYVHVDDERPEIRLFAILVRDIAHPERLPVELDILNRRHRFGRFFHDRGRVVLSYDFCAQPFAAGQLRSVVAELLLGIDGIARDLAARVGGRTWLDDDEAIGEPRAPVMSAPATAEGIDAPLEMLLELLHAGRVDTRAVANIFDGDRLAIIRRLVAVRTGRASTGGHAEEVVLEHLRRALRYVVDGDLPERARSRRRVAPRRTEQLSLVDEVELGQGTLEVE